MNLPRRRVSRFSCRQLPLAWAVWLTACAAAGPADPAAPLAHSLTGQGAGLVVVLQSGLGDGLATWKRLQADLSKQHRVLSFDRPGYGASPARSGPRDPCRIAEETRALLVQLDLPPPYLLVGHSLGGLYQHAFARRYPGEVAGLVLLDPTHPDHWARMQAEAPVAAGTLKTLRATLFSATERREFDDQAVCLDTLPSPPASHPPARLLVSTELSALERGGDFERLLQALREDWLRLLGQLEMQRVAGSGHYIHRDAPAAVVRAVQSWAASPK